MSHNSPPVKSRIYSPPVESKSFSITSRLSSRKKPSLSPFRVRTQNSLPMDPPYVNRMSSDGRTAVRSGKPLYQPCEEKGLWDFSVLAMDFTCFLSSTASVGCPGRSSSTDHSLVYQMSCTMTVTGGLGEGGMGLGGPTATMAKILSLFVRTQVADHQ